MSQELSWREKNGKEVTRVKKEKCTASSGSLRRLRRADDCVCVRVRVRARVRACVHVRVCACVRVAGGGRDKAKCPFIRGMQRGFNR